MSQTPDKPFVEQAIRFHYVIEGDGSKLVRMWYEDQQRKNGERKRFGRYERKFITRLALELQSTANEEIERIIALLQTDFSIRGKRRTIGAIRALKHGIEPQPKEP